MGEAELDTTRRSLHGVAELVLAGPQYAVCRSIRLRVTPRGFGTVSDPDLRVDGLELVSPRARLPLEGSYAALARASGVEARDLRDVYADGPGVVPDDRVAVDAEAASVILGGLSLGDAAMRALDPEQQPVLWPEHFDVGISLDEVNYGVSPGDHRVAEPYAYVGPWVQREGDFWDQDFGAMRLLRDVPDLVSLTNFFREGAARATVDPPLPERNRGHAT